MRRMALSASTEQHCYKGKGVRAQRNGLNFESAILFANFYEFPDKFCLLL